MGTIAFGRIASEGGKTYVPLDVTLPEGGSVSVSARTTGAHTVPVKILRPWGRDRRVIVLPALLATVRVNVLVRDREDFALESARLTVRPSTAFLASSLNRTRHGDEVGWYLGLDERPCGDATYVGLERLYTDFETSDVLHGTIEFTGDDPKVLMRPFEARIIDAFGRPVDGPHLVANRDDLQRQPDGSYLRSVRFSQEISRGLRSFTLWVRHPDHRIPDGFLCLDGPALARHRALDDGRRWSRPDGPGYHDWFAHNQLASALDLELERRRPGTRPDVSLLVDLGPLDPFGLDETLASLRDQVHGAWELIGYGDVAPDGLFHWCGPAWRRPDSSLDFDGTMPPRTAAEALSLARGRYIGLLDVGDTLEPDALFLLCNALGDDTGGAVPAMAYADQDLRTNGDDGHAWYQQGFLKTAFDRDLLYADGATGRPALVDRSCLDVDGLSSRDASGLALDLELALAAVETGRPIVHVPRMLYHRLAREGVRLQTETAPETDTVQDAQCRAVLQTHLDRVSIEATVRPNDAAGAGRLVDYRPVGDPLVSIVIPNKDSAEVLRRCLESIVAKSTYPLYEVIVVENNSVEPATFAYYETLEDLPTVRVIRYEGPFNFSAICNLGAREAQGEYLLFLNNDTEVLEPRWIELLLGPLMRRDVGAVGAHLLYPDGLLQHGGVIVQAEGPLHVEIFVPPAYDAYQGLTDRHCRQATAVTGACVMVPRRIFDEVGGFDERLPIAYNDVQLCVSIRERGYGVVYEPRARLHHYESYSRGLDYDDQAKVVRLVSEIGETMLRWTWLYATGDPFYDHRYAYHNEYFTLGWSPSLHAVED